MRLFRKPPPPPVPEPETKPVPRPGTVEYRRTDSFEEAQALAGSGYLNEAVLADLQSSWFYVGEPRLTDMPDFFGPFFAMLGLAASKIQGRPIRVLDFGGAIGRYGVYADAYFQGRVRFEWIVVETAMYAEKGKALNLPAIFCTSLDDVPGTVDIAMFSGVLQYIKDWEGILAHPKISEASLVFITRTPVGAETAYLQTAYYASGPMLLPARVLPEGRLKALLGETHQLFSSMQLEQHLGEMGATQAPAMIWMGQWSSDPD